MRVKHFVLCFLMENKDTKKPHKIIIKNNNAVKRTYGSSFGTTGIVEDSRRVRVPAEFVRTSGVGSKYGDLFKD